MRHRQPLGVSAIATAATMIAAMGVVSFIALSAVAKPDDLGSRLQRLDERIALTKKLENEPTSRSIYPAGTLCHGSANTASDELARRIQAGGAGHGMTLTDIVVQPDRSRSNLLLSPVSVSFRASGRYDAALRMIDELGNARPEVFVDTVDLKSQVSTVDLKFTGHFYCSTSAHR